MVDTDTDKATLGINIVNQNYMNMCQFKMQTRTKLYHIKLTFGPWTPDRVS